MACLQPVVDGPTFSFWRIAKPDGSFLRVYGKEYQTSDLTCALAQIEASEERKLVQPALFEAHMHPKGKEDNRFLKKLADLRREKQHAARLERFHIIARKHGVRWAEGIGFHICPN